jgi:hypothetical protein
LFSYRSVCVDYKGITASLEIRPKNEKGGQLAAKTRRKINWQGEYHDRRKKARDNFVGILKCEART